MMKSEEPVERTRTWQVARVLAIFALGGAEEGWSHPVVRAIVEEDRAFWSRVQARYALAREDALREAMRLVEKEGAG